MFDCKKNSFLKKQNPNCPELFKPNYIFICAIAFIWYLAEIHYLLCGGPISFRLLKQEVMSQYLVQTCSDYL